MPLLVQLLKGLRRNNVAQSIVAGIKTFELNACKQRSLLTK
jgi:hypothetical protein